MYGHWATSEQMRSERAISEFCAQGNAIGSRRLIGCQAADRRFQYGVGHGLIGQILSPQRGSESITERHPRDRRVDHAERGLSQYVVGRKDIAIAVAIGGVQTELSSIGQRVTIVGG